METQATFYTLLAEEMIDNTVDTWVRRRNRNSGSPSASASGAPRNNGSPRSGVGIHLTPTKRKRKNKDGHSLSLSIQGKCRVAGCIKKSSHVCCECSDTRGKDFFICHTKTGRECFNKHIITHHND